MEPQPEKIVSIPAEKNNKGLRQHLTWENFHTTTARMSATTMAVGIAAFFLNFSSEQLIGQPYVLTQILTEASKDQVIGPVIGFVAIVWGGSLIVSFADNAIEGAKNLRKRLKASNLELDLKIEELQEKLKNKKNTNPNP